MRALLLCLCACLCLLSCKKEDPEGVSIRVRNASQYSFENIVVNTTGGENNYGTVSAGQSSDYKYFTKAYGYGYVKLTSQGEELQIIPIDYVGESLLAPGRYTYALDVVDYNGQKRLTSTLERQ
jgi:hypothetical protein